MTNEVNGNKHFKDGVIDFAAGALGGIALVYVGQPLDTIKVKMQTFPHLYSNMVECFKKTLVTDGIYRGLYAGTVPALVTNVSENSVLFLCYGFCQKIMQKFTGVSSIDNLSIISNATAGFLASFFSSLAICPTELIKCKLQAMHEVRKQQELLGNKMETVGAIKLTAQIIRTDGLVGLLRGLAPTLVREMPGYFFFFGGYEGCLSSVTSMEDCLELIPVGYGNSERRILNLSILGTRELLKRPDQKKEDIGLMKTMIAGSVGGTIFWTLTYPVDVAKSRIQVSNIEENMILVIYKIFRKEGVGALYNGLTPTLIRTIPATAAVFVTYEYSKKWMHCIFSDT